MKSKLCKKTLEKRARVGVTRAKVEQLMLLRDKLISEESTLAFMLDTSKEAAKSVITAGASFCLAVNEIDKLISMAEEILNENEISS